MHPVFGSSHLLSAPTSRLREILFDPSRLVASEERHASILHPSIIAECAIDDACSVSWSFKRRAIHPRLTNRQPASTSLCVFYFVQQRKHNGYSVASSAA